MFVAFDRLKAKIAKKQTSGTLNPIFMEETSAMYPINIGTKAPPTTHITRMDEALSRLTPLSLTPNAKIDRKSAV